MTDLPSACVIGAGSSGIAAAKALHERGIPFDCFEKSDRVGGNWVFKNKNGMSSAYRSLHINTSRERMEYSDYPMPTSYPDFPASHPDREVLRRLRRPFRVPRADPVRDRRRARRARTRTASGRSRSTRARRAATTPCWSPTATTGTRAGPSRRIRARSTASRCTRTTTSRTPISATRTCSSSGSATARWTSRPSRASSPSGRSCPAGAARTSSPSTCSGARSIRSASTR